jgi:hypothetical protein
MDEFPVASRASIVAGQQRGVARLASDHAHTCARVTPAPAGLPLALKGTP